jgi:DNA polymerase-3 subunit alpha
VGGFKDEKDLLDNIERRHCNSKVQDVLHKVGAFAHICPGELPPRHPDRLKDQIELMPGLSSTYVSVNRRMPRDKFVMQSIGDLYGELRNCQDCSLKGGVHPLPGFGKKAGFMVITDCPTKNEDAANKMLSGDGANFIKLAIQSAGLKVNDGYFTTLVKSVKNGQTLSNDQINGCSKYLDQEIKILKPAIIVLMGGSTIKRFLPNEKKPNDVRGKVVYSKELDANLIIGMNPAVVWFDQDKQNWVDDIFMRVADLLNM